MAYLLHLQMQGPRPVLLPMQVVMVQALMLTPLHLLMTKTMMTVMTGANCCVSCNTHEASIISAQLVARPKATWLRVCCSRHNRFPVKH